MSKWNNSQISRERLVIYGVRKGIHCKFDATPDPKELLTCAELYGDLVEGEAGHIREELSDVICMHARCNMSWEAIRKQWKKRGRDKSWKVEGEKFKTAPGVYRNLDDDYPRTARKSERQFEESGLNLTPRQLARIMGVPDKFVIYTEEARRKYFIRKARTMLTKGMCYEVAKHFKNQLIKNPQIWKS